ncbi:caspase-2-like [Branchiostoma lanceolatum]|uniref:caspase-2-like n=1 Tax=Branchiostoma lanceolatum TaxID=7740 RepID=UPI003452C5C9
MDPYDQARLRKNHTKLLDNIESPHLVHYLYEKEVLSIDDMERIEAKTTTRDKNFQLLTMLPRRGEGAYGHFVAALKDQKVKVYDEIVELLEKTDVSDVDPKKFSSSSSSRGGASGVTTYSRTANTMQVSNTSIVHGSGNIVINTGSGCTINRYTGVPPAKPAGRGAIRKPPDTRK